MARNFEYDYSAHVSNELTSDPGAYIYDRMQEMHGNRYSMFIDRTANFAFPNNDEHITKYQRLAYAAGSTLVLNALDYSDLPEDKIKYTKKVFLFSNLLAELKSEDPETVKEQFEVSALVGIVSHPELETVIDIVSRYYAKQTKITTITKPVFLGVGRMAFDLDKCFRAAGAIDQNNKIAQTLAETDWSNIKPEDIIGNSK